MLKVRKSESRGYLKLSWLTSYRSFSFDEYADIEHGAYSVLNAFNEDEIEAGMGVGTKSHQDVEIVTYVVSGELHYHDNLGNQAIATKGDVQLLTAGTGVRHDEYNVSTSPVHLLQLWIEPIEKGLSPSYEQKRFSTFSNDNQWCLIVSPTGNQGSVAINQDVNLYACVLERGFSVEMDVSPQRGNYLHVVDGAAICNGVVLESGDALKIQGEASIEIVTAIGAELLWLDLPLV